MGDRDFDNRIDRDVVQAAALVAEDELLFWHILKVGTEHAGATVEMDEQLSGERNRRRGPRCQRRGHALNVGPQDATDFTATQSDGGMDSLDGLDEVTTKGVAVPKHNGSFPEILRESCRPSFAAGRFAWLRPR